MSKRQTLLIVVAIVIALTAAISIPFLLRASDHRGEAARRAQGIQLIHTFDCTYGQSLAELLSSGAYSTSLQAAASFEQAAHQHGPERAATLKIARAQQLRAADLLRQYGQIQPLTPLADRTPCPPR